MNLVAIPKLVTVVETRKEKMTKEVTTKARATRAPGGVAVMEGPLAPFTRHARNPCGLWDMHWIRCHLCNKSLSTVISSSAIAILVGHAAVA